MQRLLNKTNDMNDNNDMFSPQTQPTPSLNELALLDGIRGAYASIYHYQTPKTLQINYI